MGTALLSGTTLCGILDGQNTQLLLMGAGKFRAGRISFLLDSGETAVVRLERRRAIRRSLELEDSPLAQVTIPLRGEVELGANAAASNDDLEALLSQRLEAELNRLLSTLQSLNCDAMGFGKLAVRKFSDTGDWENYDWKEAYGRMECRFSVSLQLED